MRLIQLSDIAADPELSACLLAMQELPGAWLRSCDVVGEEACFFINETGGRIRICPRCLRLDSPNRPCACLDEYETFEKAPKVEWVYYRIRAEDIDFPSTQVRLRRSDRPSRVDQLLIQEALDECCDT